MRKISLDPATGDAEGEFSFARTPQNDGGGRKSPASAAERGRIRPAEAGGGGRTRSLRVVAFCFLALLTGCGSGGSGEAVSSRQLVDGQHFTLKNLEGEAVSFDSVLEGKKAVLLNFWATWCPPCREEIPDLITLQAKHGGEAFTILGVDVGESATRVEAFSEKMGINYPLLLDSDMEVAQTYGVVGIPTSILVTSDGMMVGKYYGYTSKLVSDVNTVLKKEG